MRPQAGSLGKEAKPGADPSVEDRPCGIIHSDDAREPNLGHVDDIVTAENRTASSVTL
jgi:hypothetical protein